MAAGVHLAACLHAPRLSPSLFTCRPRCSLVALAGRPSQFAPRSFSLAGRPSQFAPRSFSLAPQCPSRNSIRPDYFAATRSRSLFLTINECCVSAAAAAIWEIQWRRSTPQLAPVDTGGDTECPSRDGHSLCWTVRHVRLYMGCF